MAEFKAVDLSSPLPIPSSLAAMAEAAWLASLPGTLADIARRWDLEIGKPYEPGGQCSWTAPVRTADRSTLVLKVAWRHPEAEHEADGLRAWDGSGAARLHDTFTTPDTSVLLLERCDPGTPLGHLLAEPEQDEVIARLLHRLWIVPEPGHPFRPLQTMCDQWADEFEVKLARCTEPIDAGLARACLRVFRGFAHTASRHVLLCTDLHGENVLAAQREPWLVVDPKPYVGDPAYDAVQHMLNCMDRVAEDPHGFSRRMAELLDVEPDRVRTWLFARCVQECIDGEGSVRRSLLDIGRSIAP